MSRRILIFLLLFPVFVFAQDASIPESQLVLVKNSSPLIAFRILFNTGSAYDPSAKEGVAALTGSMISDAGTTRNDYNQILKLLFPMAAGYSSQVDKEMVVIMGVVHKDNLMPYYELLRDAILNPGFKKEDFDRLKADQINYVTKTLRFNDDEELGKEVLSATIFKNHPYGYPTLGVAQSVQSVTLEDVQSFYRNQFNRKNVVIGIAGNFPDSLVQTMRKDFGSLPEGRNWQKKTLPAPAPLKGISAVIVKKEAQATGMSLGHPLPLTRADKDYYNLLIANAWFGQHRNQFSHLFEVMREFRGLNYGDYSYIEHFPMAGRKFQPMPNYGRAQQIYQIWIRPVQHINNHFALRQAVRELEMLINNGMTAKNFELSKTFLLNYTTNLAQSNSEQLGYALDDSFYGLDEPYLTKLKANVASATLPEVNQALKKYLSSKNFVIAAVTKDAEAFKTALSGNKPSPIEYDSPKPENIVQEDKIIQKYQLPLSSKNITIVPVEQVFETVGK